MDELRTIPDRSEPWWDSSIIALRDVYVALYRAVGEHPDRTNLIRRAEEIYDELKQKRQQDDYLKKVNDEAYH